MDAPRKVAIKSSTPGRYLVLFDPALHSAPSVSSERLWTLDAQTSVAVAGFNYDGTWARVRSVAEETSTSTPPENWIPTIYLEERPKPTVSAGSRLNLRVENGRDAPIIRVLESGTVLHLLRWDGSREWLQVRTPEQTEGFVSTEFAVEPDGISLLDKLRRWMRVPRARTPIVFVADVRIPDGMRMAPGESFRKIWRVRNESNTLYAEGCVLAFIGGEPMGAPPTVSGIELIPGKESEIAVDMIAPTMPGQYRSTWEVRDRSGAAISLELFVEIVVAGGEPTEIA